MWSPSGAPVSKHASVCSNQLNAGEVMEEQVLLQHRIATVRDKDGARIQTFVTANFMLILPPGSPSCVLPCELTSPSLFYQRPCPLFLQQLPLPGAVPL